MCMGVSGSCEWRSLSGSGMGLATSTPCFGITQQTTNDTEASSTTRHPISSCPTCGSRPIARPLIGGPPCILRSKACWIGFGLKTSPWAGDMTLGLSSPFLRCQLPRPRSLRVLSQQLPLSPLLLPPFRLQRATLDLTPGLIAPVARRIIRLSGSRCFAAILAPLAAPFARFSQTLKPAPSLER